jgi:lipopolysaccharide export system protein LptA
MRRISILLAIAAILLSALVGYTYKLRRERDRARRAEPTPQIANKYRAIASSGWGWTKDDPQTNRPVVRVTAESFKGTDNPSTFDLHMLALKLYDKTASTYTYVKSDNALFDEGSGLLKSEGPVRIVMNVPSDKDAEDKQEAAKRVQVLTTGVTYETKSGKASTDKPASFVFPDGDGKAVGVEYDPASKQLHMKSQVSLDWVGGGPLENKMHVEAGDLVYKEAEQKIYLSPWSKLQRQSMRIEAQGSVVTLQDGVLHQIDSVHPLGSDDRPGRHVDYSASTMTALFDEDGNLVQIRGNQDAKVTSSQPGARTTLTGDKADLRFALNTSEDEDGEQVTDSSLHLVMADGHAVALSEPVPRAGVLPAETRLLRSEHIELEMSPGGQDVKEIRTSTQAQLEFKPNQTSQVHRTLDASHLRILYGEDSYVDTFLAWNVATHTDKPAVTAKAGGAGPVPPALTWSDLMTAHFAPKTNQIATIDQTGNFRYEEGTRRASAKNAFLEQASNRITLTDSAKVLDDSGSAAADCILMNQLNGDMDATGHVLSTHAPDKNQKPGTSMLDTGEGMQAQADQMKTRENNSRIHYQGNVVMWQGGNRIAAKQIDIDRDQQTLHAWGDVLSELLDNKNQDSTSAATTLQGGATAVPISTNAPATALYTIVRAPELEYRDDVREALYSGGVTLVRDKMTVKANQMRAFLTPKPAPGSTATNDSSLDHAFANGNVVITELLLGNRLRSGKAEHGEYYTKDDKVVLSGGDPQMEDSVKGVTKGRELTYFSGDDHLIVKGESKKTAFTRMKKKK